MNLALDHILKMTEALKGPDFHKVLDELHDMQGARQDRVKDAEADMAAARQRMFMADLSGDIRLWTQEQEDELKAAEIAYDEAEAELKAAREAL